MNSIRLKLVLMISLLFLFVGVLIYVPLSNTLPRMITNQILKRDLEIAQYLSRDVKDILLLNDRIALSLLLYNNLDKLEDAQYLFIQSSDGNIIAHTFREGFPKGLINFNSQKAGQSIKEFLNNGKKIYDVAVPIFDGSLGMLHLGVSLESGKEDVNAITKIDYYVVAIIVFGLGIGTFVFLIAGINFSNQIIKLKNFAIKIGDGDLDAKNDIKSKDELGILSYELNEMALHLKERIEEIKKLHIIEERNRIAFDLHDGCAQNMACIIKGIELVKKLLDVDKRKAFAELDSLKKNTKNILDKTRSVILDLKSSEDSSLQFADKLKNYFKDYENENNIKIKSEITHSINDIVSEKSKPLFYIINEAFNNIKKHSAAKHVRINLQSNEGHLTLTIEDDGKGFNVDEALSNSLMRGNVGLHSMQQRSFALGGTFKIDSVVRRGTNIFIQIPLDKIVLESQYEI